MVLRPPPPEAARSPATKDQCVCGLQAHSDVGQFTQRSSWFYYLWALPLSASLWMYLSFRVQVGVYKQQGHTLSSPVHAHTFAHVGSLPGSSRSGW